MFTAETTTLGHLAKALVFNIPRLQVPADGGPFNQLLGGHSMLHGLIAITVVMGLALAASSRERRGGTLDEVGLLVLPAFAVPTNIEVSLYCLGVAAILLFWGRVRELRTWILLGVMVFLFIASWRTMGYSHSQDAGLVTLNRNLAEEWWIFVVWLIGGLGIRLIGFRWISRPTRVPVAFLLLISVVGWLAFALLIHLRDENERYGAYFLQSIFSIFAFSRLTPRFWQRTERGEIALEWLRIVRNSVVILLTTALLFRLVIHFTHSNAWIASLRLQILPLLVFVVLIFGALALWERDSRYAAPLSALVMCVLMVGFLGWVPTWFRFGLQTVPTSVSYPPDEVRGLRRLRDLMPPGQRFATNKHTIERTLPLTSLNLSYGYSSLAEHPVLLEGYLARGENTLPWFATLFRDNDVLFSTTDPDTLRSTAKKWDVQWLVARPNTDISLPRPLPAWLTEQQGSGSLKIYRIE